LVKKQPKIDRFTALLRFCKNDVCRLQTRFLKNGTRGSVSVAATNMVLPIGQKTAPKVSGGSLLTFIFKSNLKAMFAKVGVQEETAFFT
jgi:hypothetical protein